MSGQGYMIAGRERVEGEEIWDRLFWEASRELTTPSRSHNLRGSNEQIKTKINPTTIVGALVWRPRKLIPSSRKLSQAYAYLIETWGYDPIFPAYRHFGVTQESLTTYRQGTKSDPSRFKSDNQKIQDFGRTGDCHTPGVASRKRG
ncbi:hypothetical protein ONZ45_g13925 [Pleurotus djamor]|nr:hypothetical protein ONZ45_g13925 [Pleurotus djamor]